MCQYIYGKVIGTRLSVQVYRYKVIAIFSRHLLLNIYPIRTFTFKSYSNPYIG